MWSGLNAKKTGTGGDPEEDHPYKVPISPMAPTIPRIVLPGTSWAALTKDTE
ncbi:hypothetical protein AcV7_005199 [Taiwanofungus camphoratus]|nr:hypothetical protein AcW2_005749 [Antrodia cinnamomea]KAI0929735.1 hypothetical protein AcV7_005199 [Antrodia cinnamomea]